MKGPFCRESVGGPSGLDVLVCEPLAEQGVPHGFTLRSRRWNGVEVFGARDGAERDREELARALGLRRGVAHMRQVHGNEVRAIDAPPSEPPVCDGLVTAERSLALVVQTADCVPMVFWDERHNVVAAVHAGWRGALAAVSSRALVCLEERFGSRSSSVHVVMGPAIGRCCYEVGDEVVEAFGKRFPHAEELFTSGPRGRQHLDLIQANARPLVEAGVSTDRIYETGMCTSCENERFYSYRKEGKGVGRLMGVIGAP
ncbi:MAG TPA: peptidoglycan editing factor PgeF [Vicinamibacteria bacterium]